ncbi:hypothetical protein D5S18_23690 [Nocardia panacis]|uniref:Uncharacterized protein n=1 Tax=Nocardia panacis TaxID=2340916 RepID=A0A3A4KDP4_9NOCA|nr:hypothetical protein [Nocardia panacis]RJO72172.1 hypothetical protein D5S18_23690 [Nocardia panacis]
MTGDEQIGFDFGVDVAERTAWETWVDSKRRAAQIRKLLGRAGLPALPSEPWDFESDNAIQVSEVIAELFPDMESVTLPANADRIDQLACFIGEWFVRYLDAQWVDLAKHKDTPAGYNDYDGFSFYNGIKPAVAFGFAGWKTCTAELLVKYVVETEFLNIVDLVAPAYWKLRKEDGSFADLRRNLPDHPPFL